MKTLLLLPILVATVSGQSPEREIGVIVSTEKSAPATPAVTVSHVYDGKGQLFLTLGNIAMNAGAKGVTGTLFSNKAAILVHPKERYDATGPVEGVSWTYTIRYVIPNVKPGLYTLVHDDTAADGTDRITRTVLDLTKAGKGSTTVNFKDAGGEKKPEEKAKEPVVPPPFIQPEAVVPEGEKKAG